MKNYYELRFFENPLIDNFDAVGLFENKNSDDNDTGYRFRRFDSIDAGKIVNPKIIEWANRKHVPIQDMYIFLNTGGAMPHTDTGSEQKTAMAINWCIQNPDADMEWYGLKSGSSHQESIAVSSGYYTSYNLDHLEIIEKHQIIGPTLVNVHTPHCIRQYDAAGPRIAVSIRFINNFSTWEEMVNFFKPFIKK